MHAAASFHETTLRLRVLQAGTRPLGVRHAVVFSETKSLVSLLAWRDSSESSPLSLGALVPNGAANERRW